MASQCAADDADVVARARWRAAEDDARRLALAVTQAQAAVQAAGQVLAWAASVTAKGSCAPSSRP